MTARKADGEKNYVQITKNKANKDEARITDIKNGRRRKGEIREIYICCVLS